MSWTALCPFVAALACWAVSTMSLASAQQTAQSPIAAVPNPAFLNLAAELAALSRVNPAQLAAQASANSRLAKEASAASLPEGSSPAAAVSPEMMQSLAKTKGSGYGASIPPGPNLADAVGRPTAAAAFALGTQLAQAKQLSSAAGTGPAPSPHPATNKSQAPSAPSLAPVRDKSQAPSAPKLPPARSKGQAPSAPKLF